MSLNDVFKFDSGFMNTLFRDLGLRRVIIIFRDDLRSWFRDWDR